MTRRNLIILLAVAAVAWPLDSSAQQRERPWRIGVVLEGGPYHAGVDGLREGLKAAGLEEGDRVVLLIHDTEGDLSAVEMAARGLERDDGVDLIVALAGSVALAVKRATVKVPIVFVAGSDPATLGLVESLARPGGRLSGIHSISVDLTAKRLELLCELMPTLRRVMAFYDPGNRTAATSVDLARDAAQRLGIALTAEPVRSKEEIRDRLRTLSAEDAGAFIFASDAMVLSQRGLILERTGALRMAAASAWVDLVRDGALMGYGFSYRDLGRRAAEYVARILAGTKPGELPVEAVSVPSLAINLKTARALGIEVTPALLDRADEVIE